MEPPWKWKTPSPVNDGLKKHLTQSLSRLNDAGITVESEKELPYGVQLKLSRGETSCAVNLYHSKKKGPSTVGSGGDQGLLNQALQLLARTPLYTTLETKGIRTGTDEAGKGDYFGPLVAAAVRCDEQTAKLLREMGAGDSKRLSAATVESLYGKITVMENIHWWVHAVEPHEYNTLFASLRRRGMNSLDIQAMAHGKAIEGVLKKAGGTGTIIIDKFCSMERLKPWLPEGANNIELMVRAEDREPAVAAASIIARSVYLIRLKELSGKYGVTLRPGAGSEVDATGRTLVAKQGEAVLPLVGKIHFSNTLRMTGGLDCKSAECDNCGYSGEVPVIQG